MNLFMKLLAGAFKVLLFMFLQRNTQRSNYHRRQYRSENSSFATELLVAMLLNGGSQ
jgi:hypothetical protein